MALRNGWTIEDVEDEIARNDPSDLHLVPISVSMDPPGRIWAQDVCVRLSKHANPTVRGNAILGFGHLARIFRYLNRPLVQPIIEQGLCDEDVDVRGQAYAAASDVEWFLGWILAGREEYARQPVCRSIE